MVENNQIRMATATKTLDQAQVDQGLRSFMLGVYNYMLSALLLTGAVALYVGNNEQLLYTIFSGPLAWVVMLSPLAFILVMSFGLNKLSPVALQAIFWAFAGVMGLSISTIFAVYTDASIARVFFITAASFASLSLWGYTTKRDLSGMGTFLIMGLIGLIIASIVNIFLGSSMLEFVVSVIGVLIFAGLTAYDTQKLKYIYLEQLQHSGDVALAKKMSIMGATNLYLDFVNLFMFLLSLLGNRE